MSKWSALRYASAIMIYLSVVPTLGLEEVSKTDIKRKKRDRLLEESKVPNDLKGLSLDDQIRDSFFDPKYNYSKFTGRVTDKAESSSIVKVYSQNGNVKFFRSGDEVYFRLASKDTESCKASVRSVEKQYFVLYIQDIESCWDGGRYFRRGSLLAFESKALGDRVRDASNYRIILLRRRKDFFKQLNDTNHFVWSYDQEKVQLAAEYDEKIAALRQAKGKAMDMLAEKKKDSINLQRELSYRLDKLDQDLEFYRVDKDDPKIDRWHLDHDLGIPVDSRPKTSWFTD